MRKILFLATIFFTKLSFAQAPELVVPKGHSGDVSVLALSPNNKLLASGGRDQTVILWDYESGKELKTFDGYPSWIKSIAISPDNKKIVTGIFEELRVNDPQLYGNDGALEQKGFSAVELQQMSKDIKAQKQLFNLDACQSAGALNSVCKCKGCC